MPVGSKRWTELTQMGDALIERGNALCVKLRDEALTKEEAAEANQDLTALGLSVLSITVALQEERARP